MTVDALSQVISSHGIDLIPASAPEELTYLYFGETGI